MVNYHNGSKIKENGVKLVGLYSNNEIAFGQISPSPFQKTFSKFHC